MRNITKYLKKIDDSLDTLIKNKDVVQKAQENLATINRLEEEIKKNKNIKIESMELIEQSIREVEKLIIDSKKKSKKVADVDIIINSRTYRVSCKDGEEDRIISLSSQINQEVELLASRIGQLGEARMILLAALVLLDKSDDNQDKMEEILKKYFRKNRISS